MLQQKRTAFLFRYLYIDLISTVIMAKMKEKNTLLSPIEDIINNGVSVEFYTIDKSRKEGTIISMESSCFYIKVENSKRKFCIN